jgi:hypothetical protein
MSFKRTTGPPSSRMMRLLNSSAVVRRPSVRMLSSVLNPSMRPLGSSTFSRLSALRTSTGVTLKPAIFTGSSSSFMLYFLSPHTLHRAYAGDGLQALLEHVIGDL